jgi:hypothetical protein
VASFRSLGIRAEVSHLAFEPTILDALPPASTQAVDISFVGTVSADRAAGNHCQTLRAQTVRQYRARRSRLLSVQGEAWGADMYQALRRSLRYAYPPNRHWPRARETRVYSKRPASGTFLLTDFKDNLQTLFEPNREVVARRSVNECHCGPTSVLGAPLTVRPKIAKVPASDAISL